MTPNDFIIWFRGFVKASNNYNITPKQWDDIREQLEKVILDSELKPYFSFNTGTSNTNITYGRSEDNITYTNTKNN